MRVEHLAIDGSIIQIEAEADLSTKATAAGWAVVPSLMQAHPFTVFPAGHSSVMEESIQGIPEIRIQPIEEYAIKNGRLRVAEVESPNATGGRTQVTVGAWEGAAGCLHTALYGFDRSRLIEIFDTLQFSERSLGLAIDSRVVAQPRAPELIKEIPEVGILRIRPATSGELERVPKSRGLLTDHGEFFRASQQSRDLLFVSGSTVTAIKTTSQREPAQVLSTVGKLRIEWSPRGATSSLQ
jgi:hypothetical protein